MWMQFGPAEWELLRLAASASAEIYRDNANRRAESDIEGIKADHATAQSYVQLVNSIVSKRKDFDPEDPYRAAADELDIVREGECEVDDDAVVSNSDNGAYVMAWVWVDGEDAGLQFTCTECDGRWDIADKSEDGMCPECQAEHDKKEAAE